MIVSRSLTSPAHDDQAKTYDVIAKRKEEFVRPGEKKGKITVLYRVSQAQIQNDSSGKLSRHAMDAKKWVVEGIKQLKTSRRNKDRFISLMGAQIKGNTGTSSKDFFSADQSTIIVKPATRKAAVGLVRFVDTENTDIAGPPSQD